MGWDWDGIGQAGRRWGGWVGVGLVESFSKSSLLSSALLGWATPGYSSYAGLRVRS